MVELLIAKTLVTVEGKGEAACSRFLSLFSQLFRTPSFEIIPMDLVMGKCIVMDPNTFSKGRPKGFKEQDVYVCEHRVDKTAHLFHKIQKIWYEHRLTMVTLSLLCGLADQYYFAVVSVDGDFVVCSSRTFCGTVMAA